MCAGNYGSAQVIKKVWLGKKKKEVKREGKLRTIEVKGKEVKVWERS